MQRIVVVIMHIAVLYAMYAIGSWIQISLNLLIPGSVIGMILLFLLLMTNIIKVTWIDKGAKFIISHLTFFFIPATVGIMNYFELFSGKGSLLILIVLISTVLVMAGSGIVSQFLVLRKEGEKR